MPIHKKLAPFVIVLIAAIGVFAYARHERVVPLAPHVSDAVAAAATAHATLKVGDTAYPIDVSPNDTLIEAMRALAAASTFTFTGRDYPGLGFFVDSINGKKNADGMYWILYVNGIVAPTGVSATVVHAGDTIEWKYEKSY